METVTVQLPAELVAELAKAAGWDSKDVSSETTALLALELFRTDRVSLGRAAEMCTMPVERFIQFAGVHGSPMHYNEAELEEDRRTLARLGL